MADANIKKIIGNVAKLNFCFCNLVVRRKK